MSPEERQLLHEVDRTQREIAAIQHSPGYGSTMGDSDWRVEAHIIRNQIAGMHTDQSAFERFIRQNYERNDYVAVGLGRGDSWAERIIPVEQIVGDRYQSYLRSQNVRGSSIYISLNTYEPGARSHSKENLKEIRHLGLDLDSGGRGAVDRLIQSGVPPHHVIQTSPEKHQAWWSVQGFDRERAEAATRGLIRTFGGDPAASDASRLLRAPGFTNQKPEYAAKPPWVNEVRIAYPSVREYDARVFDRYAEMGRERMHYESANRERRHGDGERKISQSERDWYHVMKELRKGREPGEVAAELARHREDTNARGIGTYKPQPHDYAARTIERAREQLEHEQHHRQR